ncbi:MAG TPA: calcium-binding protein [Phenylobacterium sp.]|nr:calcium-binding protein [Phenylobacterium sp.]
MGPASILGAVMAIVKSGDRFALDMASWGFSPLSTGQKSLAVTSTIYFGDALGNRDAFFGNFSYDQAGFVAGGTISHVQENLLGFLHFDVSGFTMSATLFFSDMGGGLASMLAGADLVTGSPLDDRLLGYAGNDTIDGRGGYDFIYGGDGDDVIVGGTGAGAGEAYLRGEGGNDSIQGGLNFDDINGNTGNDTANGGLGSDWVVGGADNDLLSGDEGDDIVYGNLGADTCDGGVGADTIRGGQENDLLMGGAGNDWLSGDRGDDTISGGSGSDIFHTSAGAGLDRVTDFSIAEGDRVQLDPGTSYFLTQVGADTVINMSGGQMVLVGVSLSSLPAGWLLGV